MNLHVFVIVLVLLVIHVNAVNQQFAVTTAEPWGSTLVYKFGIAQGGVITVDYSVAVEDTGKYVDSYILLLVTSEATTDGWYNAMPTDGSLTYDAEAIESFCTSPSYVRKVIPTPSSGTVNFKIQGDAIPYADRVTLFAFQCVPSSGGGNLSNPIAVHLEASMVNLRAGTNSNDVSTSSAEGVSHLTVQYEFAPRLYEGLLIAHFLLLLGLVGQIALAWKYPNGVRTIHWMFLVAESLYIAYLFGVYSQYLFVAEFGYLTRSYSIVPNIFDHLSATVVLLSMLLVSLGYGSVRNRLSEREMQLIVLTFSIYFAMGFVVASCNATADANNNKHPTTTSCQAGYAIEYMLRTVIFLGSILGMNYNVTSLRVQVVSAPWTATAPVGYARAKQFQVFRYVFLLYLVLPLIVSILDVTLLTWREEWVRLMMQELSLIMILIHVGITFGPVDERVWKRPFDGSLHGQPATHLE